jgi:hypothetical protein
MQNIEVEHKNFLLLSDVAVLASKNDSQPAGNKDIYLVVLFRDREVGNLKVIRQFANSEELSVGYSLQEKPKIDSALEQAKRKNEKLLHKRFNKSKTTLRR